MATVEGLIPVDLWEGERTVPLENYTTHWQGYLTKRFFLTVLLVTRRTCNQRYCRDVNTRVKFYRELSFEMYRSSYAMQT